MKNIKIKNIIFIITFTTLLIFFFVHINDVMGVLDKVFSVIAPVIYGLVIAYLMNSPYKMFNNHIFKKMGTKRKWLLKVKKPLSLILSYVIVIGLVSFLIGILVPELVASMNTLIKNIPGYKDAVIGFFNDFVVFVKDLTSYDLSQQETYTVIIKSITGNNISQFISGIASSLVPSAVSTIWDIGTGLYNWGLGLIISIYVLASKEKLSRQLKLILVAYTPEKVHKAFFKIGDVMNNKCGKFIIGKIIDSMIIGVMCFIGMTIFRFHYPLLISVIIAVFNLIPFFGPFLGALPSIFLLLIIDPWEALWFTLYIIILQQFDGNVLGPKILGESVGISGFWIMVSVIIGGGLFSLPGMFLGVPVFAAIYTLVDEGVKRRLKKKEISANDIAPPENGPEPKTHHGLKDNPLVEKASELINKSKKNK